MNTLNAELVLYNELTSLIQKRWEEEAQSLINEAKERALTSPRSVNECLSDVITERSCCPQQGLWLLPMPAWLRDKVLSEVPIGAYVTSVRALDPVSEFQRFEVTYWNRKGTEVTHRFYI